MLLSIRGLLKLRLMRAGMALLLTACTTGCPAPKAEFHLNAVYMRIKELQLMGKDAQGRQNTFQPQQEQDLSDALTAMFGTPDSPFVPVDAKAKMQDVVDPTLIRLAAGPVASNAQGHAIGLYRQHCAHCHGITGGGDGPTAVFLNPYPRDYRNGIFKFKSTPKGEKPTEADLMYIVNEGIPGTAMPSFKLLAEDEVKALVHYVKYLSIRGEVERELIVQSADLVGDERLKTTPQNLLGALSRVTARWLRADSVVTPVPQRPEGDKQASIDRGRELFYSIGECVKCHGNTQLGDGQNTDFDDWLNEPFKELNLPMTPGNVHEFESLGMLPPRNILPRNLRLGVYRGGRTPVDIWRRIYNGIDGSPMPAAAKKPPGSPPEAKGLTDDDVWAIVDYVRSLPYESISEPAPVQLENLRERM